MPSEDQQRRLEREQTDESLRTEREKADQTLEDSAIDETADAVISRARSRADKVLAASRAKTDRASVPGTPSPAILKSERAREDQVLREERATADEVLREERAEHLALLWRERQETDEDLSHERELSDDALATRDEFLAIVSHDLRNLLNGIVGSATLIEKGALQTNVVEQVATHARRIQRAGARMNRLIGDLVDVASIEAGALAVTREIGDPTTVVTEAVDAFQVQAASAGVSLAAESCGFFRWPPMIDEVLDSVSTSPKLLCKVTAAESGQKARSAEEARSALRCRPVSPINPRRPPRGCRVKR